LEQKKKNGIVILYLEPGQLDTSTCGFPVAAPPNPPTCGFPVSGLRNPLCGSPVQSAGTVANTGARTVPKNSTPIAPRLILAIVHPTRFPRSLNWLRFTASKFHDIEE
jgi:hypothetical protein